MKLRVKFGLILFIFSIVFSLDAQQNSIRFKGGNYIPAENIDAFIDNPLHTQSELYQQTYFRLIQFAQTPGSKQREALKNAGIELLNYLPEKAYFAAVRTDADLTRLKKEGATSIEPILTRFKLTQALLNEKYSEWATFENNRIGINTQYFATVASDHILAKLRLMGAEITMHNDAQMISLIIPIDKLEQLYQLHELYYFEEFDQPEEPEGTRDRTNHRSNYINTNYNGGLKFNGAGVTVMIQDDGMIGPHIDYTGRIDHRVGTNGGTHGDHCSGILMGAGNRDPRGRGMADGAFLLVYSSTNTNYNSVPNLYTNEEVVITSKSYGNGNNTGYTSLARQLDQQCRNHDALIHVFSAGNSGTSDFGYGAGSGWGNITGGHKQAKNVIAVGNLSHFDILSNSSSRGPAADGRLKPDICAVGSNVYSTIDPHTYQSLSGTSMACPAVAGSLAQLYEAYRSQHNGANPNAALINGALLNTADDLGNPGPDFRYGWGRINVRRAYELVKDGNYLTASVDQGEVNTHSLTVPAGVAELRVMVYWTDFEGTANSTKALVNDLNISLQDPSSTVFLPWVLDPTPNATALNSDAVRGIDDLNNVEQVTLTSPASGNYILTVTGTNVPAGPQSYYLVYEFVKDEIIVTYPIGNEGLIPGVTETIRWDAYGAVGNFTVEYSTDNGLNWITLNSNVPGFRRFYDWIVPNIVSGQTKVRVSRNGLSDESDQVFSIIRTPTNINIAWACPNSFNVTWSPVTGATGYEVSLLGNLYMDSVGQTSATNLIVYANSNATQWVSVKALGPDNTIGERAIAVQKVPGTFGCTLSPPLAQLEASCTSGGTGSCIQFFDVSANSGQGSVWQWYFPGGVPATSTLENPVVCYPTSGSYDVALVVKNGVGADSVFVSNYITIQPGQQPPVSETFEQATLPQDWMLNNPDNDITWEITPSAGGFGNSSSSIFIDNYTVDFTGNIDQFVSNSLDFSDLSIYTLYFDVAYAARNSSQTDTLVVYYTYDCGITLTEIWRKGGAELATANSTTTYFVPTASQWRKESASLEQAKGENTVRLVFENKSGNGNVLYLDNIQVDKVAEFAVGELILFPNPFTGNLSIGGLKMNERVKLSLYNSLGQLLVQESFEAAASTLAFDFSDLAAGVYIVNVLTEEGNLTQKLIKSSGRGF